MQGQENFIGMLMFILQSTAEKAAKPLRGLNTTIVAIMTAIQTLLATLLIDGGDVNQGFRREGNTITAGFESLQYKSLSKENTVPENYSRYPGTRGNNSFIQMQLKQIIQTKNTRDSTTVPACIHSKLRIHKIL